MYLRTLSWSVVSSKNNVNIVPSIQIFCVDKDGKSVYVRLHALSTYIMEFNDIITDDDVININDSLQARDTAFSAINDYSIALRDPTFEHYEGIEDKVYSWEKDPQGLLASFWQAKNIRPYGWIYIKEYEILLKKSSNCDLEIRTYEEFVFNRKKKDKILTRKLFWDIEVFAPDRNFTDATNPTHEIFMISAISVLNNVVTAYILTTKNTDTFAEATFLFYKTEKDLLIGFFDLWQKTNPDRCINYNGDSYDMPYVLDRAKLYKISLPSLGRLLLPSSIIRAPHPSPLGYEWDKTISSPGTEKLDLITYFRRFYPGEENYRLETIGSKYIGEGKSGLEIEDMFKAVENNDPVRMYDVSWYSYKDSILLYDIWTKLDLENTIENICNDIMCTSEELLRLTEKELLARLFYFVDYATITFGKIEIKNIPFYQPFAIKVYKDVYINKYDDLFDLALSTDEYAIKIRERIKYLPTEMKAMAIYSNYVADEIRTELEDRIKDIKDVVAIDKNFIYTLTSKIENLYLVDRYDYLFMITQSSYIFYQNGKLNRRGLHKICRPKYEYARIAVDQYLLDYIANKKVIGRKVTVKELEKIDKNLFVITDKIKPSSSYKDKSNIRSQLAESVEDTVITTWIKVKYLYTTKGVKIVKNDNVDYDLDYKFYLKDINDNYKTLDMIIKNS